MAIHAYFTVAAILLASSLGGPTDVLPRNRTVLLATHEALSGVDTLCVALATQETPLVEKLVNVPGLRAQVLARLKEAGIRHMEGEAGLCPRLVVQIEGIAVPDCDKCVCRVQTSMNRVVTFTAHRDMRVEAEVWRLQPVTRVATGVDASEIITRTVLAQVEAFADAYEAARKLQGRSAAEPNGPGPEGLGRTKSGLQDPVAASLSPFVASRSGSVFHRPECRWAQNISGDNRLGYKAREEALQAGKRPCRTCKP